MRIPQTDVNLEYLVPPCLDSLLLCLWNAVQFIRGEFYGNPKSSQLIYSCLERGAW